MENNYRDRRVRGWRTPEYVTKMMNAFWFPFPRFPPRWYAGAGAHYHKALICQTPQRLSAKVASVSPWNSGRTWDRKREPAALANEGRILKIHIHRQFFTRGIYLAAHLSRACDINACRCRVFREMEFVNRSKISLEESAPFRLPRPRPPRLGLDLFRAHPSSVHEWKEEDWSVW